MDFGCLPEALWVQIMAYLPLTDRYRLSKTCRKLNLVFTCPGVWETCCIILKMPTRRALISDFEIVPQLRLDQSQILVTTFGSFIKNLNLQLQGEIFAVEDKQEEVLKCLENNCKKLKRLSIDIKPNEVDHSDIIKVVQCLSMIRNLITNSNLSLQALNLDSWFMIEDQLALPIGCTMEALEKLSICHPILTFNKWIPMNMITPTPAEVISTIKRLQMLKILSLHCQSVSSELLQELSRSTAHGQLLHPNFTHLEILLINKACPFYSISQETWKHFSSRTPKACVSISVGNTIDPEWMRFLSCVSLHSLKFAQYSRYYPSVLSSFDPTELKSFIDFSQGCSELADLLPFVSSCPKLERLVYNGNITVSTVLKLASLKGKRWAEFKVNLDNIIIEYPHPEGMCPSDEDVILKDPLTGNVVQADLFLRPERGFYLTDDFESFRMAELEKIEEGLKKCLSCKWEPLRRCKP